MGIAKPFEISKRVVYDAYLQVKSNQGVEGVDRQSIQDFEQDLRKWQQRMQSDPYRRGG